MRPVVSGNISELSFSKTPGTTNFIQTINGKINSPSENLEVMVSDIAGKKSYYNTSFQTINTSNLIIGMDSPAYMETMGNCEYIHGNIYGENVAGLNIFGDAKEIDGIGKMNISLRQINSTNYHFTANFQLVNDSLPNITNRINIIATNSYGLSGITNATIVKIPDSDFDGLSDWDERDIYGTNPLIADTDKDGLSDYQEIQRYTSTNPLIADTDGDKVSDGTEFFLDTNPLSTNYSPAISFSKTNINNKQYGLLSFTIGHNAHAAILQSSTNLKDWNDVIRFEHWRMHDITTNGFYTNDIGETFPMIYWNEYCVVHPTFLPGSTGLSSTNFLYNQSTETNDYRSYSFPKVHIDMNGPQEYFNLKALPNYEFYY
jgi:hypothetical protein